MPNREQHFAAGSLRNGGNWGMSDPRLVPDIDRLMAMLDHPSFNAAKLDGIVSAPDVPQETNDDSVTRTEDPSPFDPLSNTEKIEVAGRLILAGLQD